MVLLKFKFTEPFKNIIAFIGSEKIPQGLSSNSSGKTNSKDEDKAFISLPISEGHGKPRGLRILPLSGDSVISWGPEVNHFSSI